MPTGYPKNGKRRQARKAAKIAVAVAQDVQDMQVTNFAQPPSAVTPLYWRRDREYFRVWNKALDMYGQFEVLSRSEFAELERFCRMFSIELIEAED